MSCSISFYRCDVCGNLSGLILASGAPMSCCGQHMTLLVANTTDASVEKHVPAVSVAGDTVEVQVGTAPHPMIREHYIQWYTCTPIGGILQMPQAGDAPKASFKRLGARRRWRSTNTATSTVLWKAVILSKRPAGGLTQAPGLRPGPCLPGAPPPNPRPRTHPLGIPYSGGLYQAAPGTIWEKRRSERVPG